MKELGIYGPSPKHLLPAATSPWPPPWNTNILRSFTAGWSASLSCLCVHLLMINPKLFSVIYAWNILAFMGRVGREGSIANFEGGGGGLRREQTCTINYSLTILIYFILFHIYPAIWGLCILQIYSPYFNLLSIFTKSYIHASVCYIYSIHFNLTLHSYYSGYFLKQRIQDLWIHKIRLALWINVIIYPICHIS